MQKRAVLQPAAANKAYSFFDCLNVGGDTDNSPPLARSKVVQASEEVRVLSNPSAGVGAFVELLAVLVDNSLLNLR